MEQELKTQECGDYDITKQGSIVVNTPNFEFMGSLP
jgi:hypothetical protein